MTETSFRGPRWRHLAVLLTIAFVGACSKTVTLTNKSGNVRLVYSCNSIERQVDTRAEIEVLADYARRAGQDASASERVVSVQSINSAWQSNDVASLEQIVVEYLCKYSIDGL